MSMAQAQLDTRAIERAAEASAKADAALAGHQILRENLQQLREENRQQHEDGREELRLIARRLHDRFDDLELRFNARQIKVASMVIVLLLGVLGFLITEGLPWS